MEGGGLRGKGRSYGGEIGLEAGKKGGAQAIGGDYPKDWKAGCAFPDTWSGWRDRPCRYSRPLMLGRLGGAGRVWKATQESGPTGPADSEGIIIIIYRLPV